MTTSGSRAFVIVLLLLGSLSSLLYYILLNEKLCLQKYHLDVPQRNISILLWHWPFGRSYQLDGNKCLEMYNISRCFLTHNISSFSTADVVVFHHQELSRGLSSMPLHQHRPASQHWVWLSMEPPINNANLTQLNGLFNWTMSYRRDADISIPYGKTMLGGDGLGFQAPLNRSCFVSWVVSRYRPHQARAVVYQSLKKYIPIEVYGKWNKKPLSDKELLPTIAKCLFYLSFENSETTDYISEKLWRNAFQAGAVPVVLGPSRATYEALAPPGSFIHVSDFKSTADLAAYLKHVAADRQAYEEYFQWRSTHRIKTITDWRERLCHICVKYSSLPANRVYQDLDSWVNS
ncbi:alpha-(1,3)-fucosyltransferase 7-like [Micropterus salmoides]|uniref:alpha-(1,3)-fucosyltransferase 7-like n=1 Tax=Micropterus salmoides TaxID=27706 RepID=UPI0018EC2E60|nr:alpha-(1,3)-fucosyltransferase 7-like [Micropterus salmoides]XP_038560509.1 alpha-(1,3)-fucosyltransferase 7-like [Micropterus salmoides]XP_038560510.1 alpha-(1,3)-fucosyltransferase 7-like [Micropterus salmoides]XP_038594136.1 alpha-(1,3)-fucosyltransferase 7-like [Micropterus salmoides]XP_038594137.1 alpha-(1,3)-fucosyltransferase 7-like [Micropterus salmoides]XP_038594138.1 alpha-(1,3)-fucosyltransferase 7-like [Micropterus salmoides]